jgi:hypothetical protein
MPFRGPRKLTVSITDLLSFLKNIHPGLSLRLWKDHGGGPSPDFPLFSVQESHADGQKDGKDHSARTPNDPIHSCAVEGHDSARPSIRRFPAGFQFLEQLDIHILNDYFSKFPARMTAKEKLHKCLETIDL